MHLLLPEAARPALSPGHTPSSGAPGPPAGVRTTRLPSRTLPLPTFSPSAPLWLLSTLMATPVPTAALLGNLRPPSLFQGEVMGTSSSPRGPEAPRLAAGPSPCWHLEAMHESGSHWIEPGCSQCWCEDGEVTCEKVKCEAACSHPIPSKVEGCCPLCTGEMKMAVYQRGELAGHVLSPFLPSGSKMLCPPDSCGFTSPQSDCCTCVPVRCYFHGRWYEDGAVFSGGGDECTTCVCQNGEVECSFMPCPELACPREEWRLGPGQCCFTCQEPTPVTGCSLDDNGVEFPIGQIWSPGDPCELCICQADGSVSCKRTDCVDSCPHPIRIPGQCCPDCSAGCTYTGRIFYNNETFPSVLDPCLSCICLLGSVACSPVDCPITCTYPFHPDGECCPVCRDCNYEGRKVANGQVFTLDDEPCTRCTCQLGEVSCEKIPCQRACTDPALLPGECCSSCPGKFPVSSGRKAGALPSQKGGIRQSCSDISLQAGAPSPPAPFKNQLKLGRSLCSTLTPIGAVGHVPRGPWGLPSILTRASDLSRSPYSTSSLPRGSSATCGDSRALLCSLWGPDSLWAASSACHPPNGSFSTFHDGPWPHTLSPTASRLSAALAATTCPGPQHPPVGASQGEESTV
uniref:von Willebrand factor C and EGF domains n=1 Tax=Saimiri boliviensis boliviensis TaxID=39432 RepID=A0A2K6URA5_SAIBB